jgi:hypothetical protein
MADLAHGDLEFIVTIGQVGGGQDTDVAYVLPLISCRNHVHEISHTKYSAWRGRAPARVVVLRNVLRSS